MTGAARRAFVRGAVAALAGIAPVPAVAHPHVWIENITTFVFDGPRLGAVRLTWTFDEFFGAAIVERFDANRNGRFEAEEVARLRAGAFDSLKGYDYFTHILVDGQELPQPHVARFDARVQGGQLVYEFTVPLPAPVDPASVEVIATVYDESRFVEVTLEPNDPVRFDGMPPGRCAFAIRESRTSVAVDAAAPYQLVSLACRSP